MGVLAGPQAGCKSKRRFLPSSVMTNRLRTLRRTSTFWQSAYQLWRRNSIYHSALPDTGLAFARPLHGELFAGRLGMKVGIVSFPFCGGFYIRFNQYPGLRLP